LPEPAYLLRCSEDLRLPALMQKGHFDGPYSKSCLRRLCPCLHRGNVPHLARVPRQRSRAFDRTCAALQAMSDRDLADIGITRFMIGDVAAEQARRA
jgi:uncharacterized protein YjiS (DUF1127 family)